MATHLNFRAWIEGHGLEFFELPGDSEQLLSSPAGIKWMESGPKPFSCFPLWFDGVLGKILYDIMFASWNATAGCDLLIAAATIPWGPDLALGRNIPFIHATQWPVFTTSEFLPFLMPPAMRAGKFLTAALHNILGLQLWLYIRRPLNRLRAEEMKLPPANVPTIARENWKWIRSMTAVSPEILPQPKDWPPHVEVTGPWFLETPADFGPPEKLVDFLAAGPAPICIGFGSMAGSDPSAFSKTLIEAVRLSGQRAILISGWGGIRSADLPGEILMIDSVPHDWLFPQVSAVVSHGGAGTLWATLRAGIPPIIVPFCADQRFWGDRIAKLGIGPSPIPYQKLTAEQLSQAITAAVTAGPIRTRAREIGSRVAAERGLERAVEFIYKNIPPHLIPAERKPAGDR